MGTSSYRHAIPSHILITLILLGLAGLSVAQTPTSSSSQTSPTSSSTSPDPQSTCGFTGDNNTYGLGIRLGIYLQWITSAIAYNFVPEEAVTMRSVNNFFTLSNFISLLYITATNGSQQPAGQLYTVEAWILLSFCLGGVASGRTKDSNGDSHTVGFAGHKASVLGGIIQLLITSATIFYAIWFLYIGMDKMLYNKCSTYAFFFAKVNIYHWFRTFNKVIFTFSGIIIGIMLIIFFFYLIYCLIQLRNPLEMAYFLAFKKSSSGDGGDDEGSSHFGFNFTLIFFIINTELVIRWNHIAQVNNISGTGQIIPIVVAGAGLVRVIWKLVVFVMKLAVDPDDDFDDDDDDDDEPANNLPTANEKTPAITGQQTPPAIKGTPPDSSSNLNVGNSLPTLSNDQTTSPITGIVATPITQ